MLYKYILFNNTNFEKTFSRAKSTLYPYFPSESYRNLYIPYPFIPLYLFT